ncbi:Phospholipid-transporting ATPase 1 [Camellia lanceoleosa]|uniref:Phospholipid-transporting ATPase 1 n=1 Tax=Camellia lanceoleosa TaxID=1840588 RepID=A0ACC0IWQ5_9ERIC|nr:Phospholipid-transporting ATPase 1 [Camellia lanceoleosa]
MKEVEDKEKKMMIVQFILPEKYRKTEEALRPVDERVRRGRGSMGWYTLFTGFTLTTAITEWSSVLYSVIYSSFPTIFVGIVDKDLSRMTLLRCPQLYGAGQRGESYNEKLFWITMADTLWQSVVAFFLSLFVYWHNTIDGSSLGDLWTLAVVILVNIHLAMDVIRWTWITHVVVWGSIVATFICVLVIDVIPGLPGYW